MSIAHGHFHVSFTNQEEKLFQGKMRLVLDEWVATTVQQYFGKATPENDDKFHAFLKVKQVPLLVRTVFAITKDVEMFSMREFE